MLKASLFCAMDLRTAALAAVWFFFTSCSAEKNLLKSGTGGASLSAQQQQAADHIDTLISQQLGETDGLCKEGYANYKKCFKQEIYRLLAKYYHTSTTGLVDGTIAGPASPAQYQNVFEINIPELAANDIIYLMADFAIYAPTSNGLLVTVELIHIDNDAASTVTVLGKAHGSLSGKMKYKRISLSGMFTASGKNRSGKFVLRAQTSIPAGSDWNQGLQPLKLDASSQLTALHYKTFTVDDIFGDESKAKGYYQVEGYSHFTPVANQSSVTGTGKNLLENLKIKNLEKDDILLLRFSGSFDYFDSFSGCVDVPKIQFSFANVNGTNLTPMGTAIPAVLPNTGDSYRREADVQFVHGLHLLDISEDKSELDVTVKLDQEGSGSADCAIALRNGANAMALTYELYRPISKLKDNYYIGKFLAEVSNLNDDTSQSIEAAPYNQEISSKNFATTVSVPLKKSDVVFTDGGLDVDAGTLGVASKQINGEIQLSEALLGSDLNTHIIRQSLNDRHARDHLYLHRAMDIFDLVPEGEMDAGRFQVTGKFSCGAPPNAPEQPETISIVQSNITVRVFRLFDSEDKMTKTSAE